MLSVIKVDPIDGHRLLVEFSDGAVLDVDCAFLLRGSLGEPLRDPIYFRRATVDEDLRTVVWPNGLDPSPEVLRDAGQPVARARVASSTA